jgi:UDP-GlcNAc:undecaprenyl-phosphate GlcNAc-1-phosphate transferase
VAIAAGTFFVYSHQLLNSGSINADNSGLLIAIVCLGLCLGFLPHNFHPAKIFMGDAGAMLLGVLMAASTLSVVGQTDNAFSGRTYFTFAPIFIPFFILGIPMLDTAFAIVRRAGRRGNPTKPDKDHLHHRLMRLGHGQRRSVMILWAWTALLSGLVLYPTFSNNQGNAIIPFGVLTLGVLLYTVFAPSGRRAAPAGTVVAGGTEMLDVEGDMGDGWDMAGDDAEDRAEDGADDGALDGAVARASRAAVRTRAGARGSGNGDQGGPRRRPPDGSGRDDRRPPRGGRRLGARTTG